MSSKRSSMVIKNRDSKNYVLTNGYFPYFVMAKYIFFFWFIVTIFIEENYEYLTNAGNRDDIGRSIISLTLAMVALVFFIPVNYFFNQKQAPYPLIGIVFLLMLIILGLLFFTYDVNEINGKYEKNPYKIGLTFILLYAFVMFFEC